MAHLGHHSLPLLGGHALTGPLLLLLLRVLERSPHPLLRLRAELDLLQVSLLRGLLHVSASAGHHSWGSSLRLVHVGSSCCCLDLRGHPLRSNHPHCSQMSHVHLLPWSLLVVGHQTRTCCVPL